MKLCNAPFCDAPKYINKSKSYGYCRTHINERQKYSIKSFKEVLPLWSFKRCSIHGLLNFDQVYLHYHNNKLIAYECKYCKKSYLNSRYDPAKEKIKNSKKSSQKRNRELKCIYGITLEQYNELLLKQNGSCAICKTTSIKRKSFDVDHCHKTNIVRGLLCHSCNVGLGFFKDDIYILTEAIKYLSITLLG